MHSDSRRRCALVVVVALVTRCRCNHDVFGAVPFQSTGGSISFGNAAPDYTTTASQATQRHDAVFEGKRQVNVQKTNFLLGDDASEFVSARMAEEGLQARPKLGRYKPMLTDDATSKATAALLGPKASKGAVGSSWTMGSAEWEPQTSSSSSYPWPTTADGAALRGTIEADTSTRASVCVPGHARSDTHAHNHSRREDVWCRPVESAVPGVCCSSGGSCDNDGGRWVCM